MNKEWFYDFEGTIKENARDFLRMAGYTEKLKLRTNLELIGVDHGPFMLCFSDIYYQYHYSYVVSFLGHKIADLIVFDPGVTYDEVQFRMEKVRMDFCKDVMGILSPVARRN